MNSCRAEPKNICGHLPATAAISATSAQPAHKRKDMDSESGDGQRRHQPAAAHRLGPLGFRPWAARAVREPVCRAQIAACATLQPVICRCAAACERRKRERGRANDGSGSDRRRPAGLVCAIALCGRRRGNGAHCAARRPQLSHHGTPGWLGRCLGNTWRLVSVPARCGARSAKFA